MTQLLDQLLAKTYYKALRKSNAAALAKLHTVATQWAECPQSPTDAIVTARSLVRAAHGLHLSEGHWMALYNLIDEAASAYHADIDARFDR